jgi:hypothetical protein
MLENDGLVGGGSFGGQAVLSTGDANPREQALYHC